MRAHLRSPIRAHARAVNRLAGGAPASVTLVAGRFAGDAAYWRVTQAIGGANPNGATSFEVQALVYIEGARETQDRVFMVQFPASRQAGLFCSNVAPHNLHAGDSQVGSVGGAIGVNPGTGQWCLLTFSADATPGVTGVFHVTCQSLDGSIPYTAGGRTKGIEVSLQGTRVDGNGGGVDFGFAGGIRYAVIRAYNAERNQAQREADLLNIDDPTGSLFFFIFSDVAGVLTATDISGNGKTMTLVGGTVAVGPTI